MSSSSFSSSASDSDQSVAPPKSKRRRKVYTSVQNKMRQSAKQRKLRGQSYVSAHTHQKYPRKRFKEAPSQCCSNKCGQKVSELLQREKFNHFYALSCKETQDACLAASVIRRDPKKKCNLIKSRVTWCYSLMLSGRRKKVCRTFILKLYQVSEKRLRVIQNKILVGDDFREQRGTHHNHAHKLNPRVKTLMKEHFQSIPSHESHYSGNKTTLKYFDNPDITIKALYEQFTIFFRVKTKRNLKMSYEHYFKLYKSQSEYSIGTPKSDVCNTCAEFIQKLNINPNDPCRAQYEAHLNKVEQRQKLKDRCLLKAKQDQTFFVLEFDYSQNFPIPRLNVNAQFYLRMLWLYVFNVHVFNTRESYFYSFLETQARKDASSVVSFLIDILDKLLSQNPGIKTIVMLSDSTSGQNRNITMVRFCSWYSQTRGVKLVQLFPVVGHSFSQNDRNFGLVRSKVKKREVIGSAKPYLEAIILAREKPKPFTLIMNRELLKDWNASLKSLFPGKPKSEEAEFGIMQFVIIRYEPDGRILCSKSYSTNYTEFKFSSVPSMEVMKAVTPVTVPYPEVSAAKIKDVRSLLRFLPKDDKAWLENVIDDPTRW